ncbi:unnamed protein product, partial [Allacma fusca]
MTLNMIFQEFEILKHHESNIRYQPKVAQKHERISNSNNKQPISVRKDILASQLSKQLHQQGSAINAIHV